MTGRLYIDIETTYVQGELREVARPFMKYHKGLKDPAKIAEAQEANLDQTALNGLWGEVVAIAYRPDDMDAFIIHREHDCPEAVLLDDFRAQIDGLCMRVWHKSSPCLIGHNITGFDIRFLWQRYVVNGLTPPHWLTRAFNAKPWDDNKVFDTQYQWSRVTGRSDKAYTSLAALCAGLGIEVPKTIDGSEVPRAWLEGRYDEIRAHVLADVEAVREVHRRMRVT